MRYTQLRAFDAVARELSFSGAAAHIGLTQPALTIQVRDLEQAYSVLLFDRQGRGVILTEAGHSLFALTQEMFDVEDRARSFLDASLELETGEIRLSADGPHAAMKLIALFHKRYPGIKISVALGNARTVWLDLIEQRADLAIVANPPRDDRIHVHPLWRRKMVAIVPLSHRWSDKKSISIKMLQAESLIFREKTSNTAQTLRQALKDNGLQITPTLELGSREGVLEAVGAGLGIGFAFEREVRNDERYKILKLTGTKLDTLDTVTCYHSHRNRRVVKAFLEIANTVVPSGNKVYTKVR